MSFCRTKAHIWIEIDINHKTWEYARGMGQASHDRSRDFSHEYILSIVSVLSQAIMPKYANLLEHF